MTGSVKMKLVFRLAEIGFALSVADLVEILEGTVSGLDRSAADPSRLVIGALAHRGDLIPVKDLRKRFGLREQPVVSDRPVLILSGEEGPWGIIVDRVEGIFPDAEFDARPLPPLFAAQPFLPFDRLVVRKDEPLVLCESTRLESRWVGP